MESLSCDNSVPKICKLQTTTHFKVNMFLLMAKLISIPGITNGEIK